jgi:3',5'-cyclic AMP phosphodiesterase CpdA
MTKTSFIHITDLHITSPKLDEEHVYSDTKKNLEITKEIIRGIKDTPKFILISGDLTNSGDKESFVTLREMMEEIDIPKFYTLGNHDTREGYYKGFLQEESKDSYVDYETVIENIHLIVLDTSRTHVVGGVLDESQFDFLTESLNTL